MNTMKDVIELMKFIQKLNYDKSSMSSEQQMDSTEKISISENEKIVYKKVKDRVLNDKKTSVSYIQRKLELGYNAVNKAIEQLEVDGILSSRNENGIRIILKSDK